MPKAKSKGIGKRRTGGGRTKGKLNKQAARNSFEARHIDQVFREGHQRRANPPVLSIMSAV